MPGLCTRFRGCPALTLKSVLAVLLAFELPAVNCALLIDEKSWSDLDAGSEYIYGHSTLAPCARLVRMPCTNVDFLCSEENPVYRLDTAARMPGWSRARACWPMIIDAGHAPCAPTPTPLPAASRRASMRAPVPLTLFTALPPVPHPPFSHIFTHGGDSDGVTFE